jgi:large subunit ribosomal protein L16
MLQPARRKYRKEHKGRNTGIATSLLRAFGGCFGKGPVGGALRSRWGSWTTSGGTGA